MPHRLGAVAVAVIAVFGLSACTNRPLTEAGEPTPSPPPAVDQHESAPASPIAFGTHVPHGAVQLGPLVRWRSDELIEAFTPDLEAIEAEREAEKQRDVEEKMAEDPDWTPPTPTATPTLTDKFEPGRDSFSALEETPRADTFVSLMRVDGPPTQVVRSMLAQLAVLLPEAGIVSDDLAEYCEADNRRVTSCELTTSGTTPGGREILVHLTVDPGDVEERVGHAASLERPVMALQIRQTDDPREAQTMRDPEDLESPVDISEIEEKSGWIWPKMDEMKPADEPLIGKWVAPSDVDVLLSGNRPAFVVMSAPSAAVARDVALAYTEDRLGEGEATVDVMADLNENMTSYFGDLRNGTQIRGVHIASARGNFAVLFRIPADW